MHARIKFVASNHQQIHHQSIDTHVNCSCKLSTNKASERERENVYSSHWTYSANPIDVNAQHILLSTFPSYKMIDISIFNAKKVQPHKKWLNFSPFKKLSINSWMYWTPNDLLFTIHVLHVVQKNDVNEKMYQNRNVFYFSNNKKPVLNVNLRSNELNLSTSVVRSLVLNKNNRAMLYLRLDTFFFSLSLSNSLDAQCA